MCSGGSQLLLQCSESSKLARRTQLWTLCTRALTWRTLSRRQVSRVFCCREPKRNGSKQVLHAASCALLIRWSADPSVGLSFEIDDPAVLQMLHGLSGERFTPHEAHAAEVLLQPNVHCALLLSGVGSCCLCCILRGLLVPPKASEGPTQRP